MKPIDVKVFVESDAAHTTQFYSGLYMLQDEGLVKVSLAGGKYSHLGYIRLSINDKPVYIDLNDHSKIDEDAYQQHDFYFKRMLLQSNSLDPRILPYGLNYAVYYKNDRTFRRSLFSRNRKYILNTFARSNNLISSIFNINLAHHTARVHHFEQAPISSEKPKVIFSARLWNPRKPSSKEKQAQRSFINEQRIAIVREGRKRFKDGFVGGIDAYDYARQTAPDALIEDENFSHKTTYLDALRQCSIGIATPGLEDSIGFKFAEYVCMSKAIVSSSISNYCLPGDFEEGKNYLLFDNTPADCIAKCEQLINDASLRKYLMENNQRYYQEYLRPNKLVWNIIKTVADA